MKPGKNIELEIEGGARIVPLDLNSFAGHGDTFEMVVAGIVPKTGRFVRVRVTVPRNYIRNLASGLWNVIFAEEAKTAAKRRAMQENK
jgi:hypothetical protein